MEHVTTFSPYIGYEWHDIEIYYDKTRNLWTLNSQSGCSCSYFEHKPAEDQNWKSWNDFLTEARNEINNGLWDSQDKKVEAIAQLRTLRVQVTKC